MKIEKALKIEEQVKMKKAEFKFNNKKINKIISKIKDKNDDIYIKDNVDIDSEMLKSWFLLVENACSKMNKDYYSDENVEIAIDDHGDLIGKIGNVSFGSYDSSNEKLIFCTTPYLKKIHKYDEFGYLIDCLVYASDSIIIKLKGNGNFEIKMHQHSRVFGKKILPCFNCDDEKKENFIQEEYKNSWFGYINNVLIKRRLASKKLKM